jgi:hypothetical protein
MTLSIPLSYRRYLPFALTVLTVMVLMSTGLSAQGVTPLESAASKFYSMLARMFPFVSGIMIFGCIILLASGHHDAWSRLVTISFCIALGVGALTYVAYFSAI